MSLYVGSQRVAPIVTVGGGAVDDVEVNGTSVVSGGVANVTTAGVLPSQSGNSGKFLTTDGSAASWADVDSLPSQTGQSGKYLTTNGTTASWSEVDSFPSQSGNSGKFLTTDGTDVSWADVDSLPSQTGQSGKFLTTNGSAASWVDAPTEIPSQTGNANKVLTTNGTSASWGDLLTRNIGEIVTSTIPLTDAGLHLLDGALIQYGSYSAFVDYIADLVIDYPDLFETEANWQSAVTTYGVCGKFVYDSVNNTVRLPKFGSQIYSQRIATASTVPVVGNGYAMALTTNPSTSATSTAGTHYFFESPNNSSLTGNEDIVSSPLPNGTTGGTVGGFSNSALIGLSPNPTISGVIANTLDVLTTSPLNCYYYIVIATSTKTAIQVDIDEIATDLNGKAGTDGSNMISSVKNFDGGWVHSMSYLINSTTSLAAQTSRSFDLSSYLPNDNYQYEVIVSVTGTTSTTSGQAFNTWFKSDIFTSAYSFVGTRVITRTSSSMNSGTTVAIPVGTGRSIAIYNGSTYAGSITELWLSGYRRIGTNQ